jgi:hypothetical protein
MLCCLRLRWAWKVVVVFGTWWVVSSDGPNVENGLAVQAHGVFDLMERLLARRNGYHEILGVVDDISM